MNESIKALLLRINNNVNVEDVIYIIQAYIDDKGYKFDFKQFLTTVEREHFNLLRSGYMITPQEIVNYAFSIAFAYWLEKCNVYQMEVWKLNTGLPNQLLMKFTYTSDVPSNTLQQEGS